MPDDEAIASGISAGLDDADADPLRLPELQPGERGRSFHQVVEEKRRLARNQSGVGQSASNTLKSPA